MAFDKKYFSSGGNHTFAPTIHTYLTNDTIADVNTEGYFNDIAGELRVGDKIYVYADADGGTPTPADFYVNANDGAVVDVANGDALTTTDAD